MTESYMEALIHTADGKLKQKGLPEEIQSFLINCTFFREEVNAIEFGHEGDEIVRDMADGAASLCDKYNIKYVRKYEYNDDGYDRRAIYSDGTKGEWE